MFIAYALDMSDPRNDQEVECADLVEALLHLRELITSEMEQADRPCFDCYGIRQFSHEPHWFCRQKEAGIRDSL